MIKYIDDRDKINMPRKNDREQRGPTDAYGLVTACRRLHAAIDQLDAKAASLVGISRNDLRCLNRLEHRPQTPKELAHHLGLTSGSVTALLDRLEHRGLVRRSPHPKDRRAVLVNIEPKVFEDLAAVYRPFGEALVELTRGLSKEDAAAAVKHLDSVSAACESVVD
ncbi:MAG: MarR family transcriptional regulator [Acidobacteriota bacterium]